MVTRGKERKRIRNKDTNKKDEKNPNCIVQCAEN